MSHDLNHLKFSTSSTLGHIFVPCFLYFLHKKNSLVLLDIYFQSCFVRFIHYDLMIKESWKPLKFSRDWIPKFLRLGFTLFSFVIIQLQPLVP